MGAKSLNVPTKAVVAEAETFAMINAILINDAKSAEI
jgi:hypothetical protein